MTEFGLLTGLSWFSLNDNDLKGTIPTEFGNLVNMTRLVMKDCLLTGTFCDLTLGFGQQHQMALVRLT
jgi:hypothetical protein